VGSLDSSKSPADGFQGLVQQSDSLLTSTGYNGIPDKANIQHIHSLRNDAQHKAKYPNESDVSDCRTYTRDFLKKMISDLWDIDFEQLSLVDVIQHENVKQYLTDAENYLAQGNYIEAINSASAGLAWTLNRVEKSLVGQLPSFSSGIMLMDSFGVLISEKESKDGYRAIERMQETLLYIALGMNYTEFKRYQKFVGQVVFTGDGKPHRQGKTEPAEPSDAEFVVAYAVNTVVQIEGIVGNIDAPFGSEWWF
jgi:hypothetical protein